ncbi:MAG: D-aminoacyl-tRNA deacylase [Nanoarchaeota archaeon]
MYKKYLVVASKLDKAGINITTQLSQFKSNLLPTEIKKDSISFDFYLVEDEILYEKNLDMNKINQYDFIIFASRHKSEKREKTISIHAPGNFRSADYGGQQGKLSQTSALFQKFMFEELNEKIKEHKLEKYKVTLECTHHGPLTDKPCLFVEIGSTEIEWTDKHTGFIVAKTIRDTMNKFKENKYQEVAIGIGGPHYCPNFNQIQLKSNVAISHVIPQYASPITEEMILEAIKKTEEEVDFVVLDWKGLGTSEQRQEILDILGKNYIQYKKTSEISKQ